ncbi:MAG: DUF3010 family protein [Deltaproteobacteria bacterium]|nr:DUF3010 family protein [Deltaproteobacteria bacterium]
MSRICGIELKSSEAILLVLEDTAGEVAFIDIEPRKIKIGDDESVAAIKSFFDSFVNFVRDNHVDIVVLKKRAKKGQMAGGAVSFKLEALIQLNGLAKVEFVSGQGIAASNKREPFNIPDELNKYQRNAFMTASLHIRQR